jgi:hypothetical protein
MIVPAKPDGTGLAHFYKQVMMLGTPIAQWSVVADHHTISFYAIGSRLALSLAVHNSGSYVAPYAADCFLRDRRQPTIVGRA